MPNYRRMSRRIAVRHGLDPNIFERQINAESGFADDVIHGRRVSSKDARGIAQIIPSTAAAWHVNPLNPRAALNAAAKHLAGYVRQYGSYDKALRAYNAGPAAIQRSYGFGETNAYVAKILRGHDPGRLNAPNRSVQIGRGGRGGGGSVTQQGEAGPAVNVTELLSTLAGSRQQQSTVTPPPAPSFSAAPATPIGYPGVPEPTAVQRQPTDYAKAISTLAQATALQPLTDVSRTATGGGGGSGGGGVQIRPGVTGRVTVASGANRSGVKLQPAVVKFVSRVAGIDGRPLTIGTGTNHNRLTINGTVSDHWRGAAADIPLAGKALVRAGRAALIAAGMPPAKARKINGGGFNVGGWQVIFNTNAPGWGDHTDHLHVGRRG